MTGDKTFEVLLQEEPYCVVAKDHDPTSAMWGVVRANGIVLAIFKDGTVDTQFAGVEESTDAEKEN